MPCLVQKPQKQNENQMSLIIGAFVAFCSITSSLTVITDWVCEDETPINVAPLNFSADLLNKDAESILPYTRMGSDDALDFWPEVEEGEVEKIVFEADVLAEAENNARWERAMNNWPGEDYCPFPPDLYEAEERAYHHASLDANDWKYIKNSLRGKFIFKRMVLREMKNPTLVGVAQPD